MQIEPFQFFMTVIAQLPWWVKTLFVLLVVAKIVWPESFSERDTSPRPGRRRRRRFRDD